MKSQIVITPGSEEWNLIFLALCEMSKPSKKHEFSEGSTIQQDMFELQQKYFRATDCRKMTFDEFTKIWSKHSVAGFSYGLDSKVFFRHDSSTDAYSLVLRFPDSEFTIDCCVHLYDDFKKVKSNVTLVQCIPHSISSEEKVKLVTDILKKALDSKSTESTEDLNPDLPF